MAVKLFHSSMIRCSNDSDSSVLCVAPSMHDAVLVALYEEPEKPPNAIEFIKMQLGAPTGTDVEALKAENEALKSKAEELEAKLADVSKKLEESAPAE